MKRRTYLSLLLLACLALTSPVMGQTAPLNVPFVHQARNGCGAASIAMLEAYWNASQSPAVPSPQAEVMANLSATQEEGTSLAEMRRYLNSNGYHAFTLHGSMADLERQVSKGRALIVLLEAKRGGKDLHHKDLHYVVVTGTSSGKVFVNDPAKRKPGTVDRAKFEAAWARAGSWMLLGVPRPVVTFPRTASSS